MQNELILDQGCHANLTCSRAAEPCRIPLCGRYQVEHWRDGTLLRVIRGHNGITNEGKNKLLNVMFHGDTAIGAWYVGLIDNAGYTQLQAGDTYANIDQPGNQWDEFASYTDGNNADNATTRPVWPANAAASQAISNTTLMVFNITGSGTVKGLFAAGGANAQTKSDHTGGNVLWATALFGTGDQAVQNGDTLKVTYTVTG